MGISITTDKDKTLDQLKDTKLQDLITALEEKFAKTTGDNIVEKDFATILLAAKNSAGTKTVLAEEVAKEPVVKDIFAAKNSAGTKTVLAEEVAKEPVVKDIFAAKNSAGTKTVLAEEVEDKAIAGAILSAKDDNKLILVEKLAASLDSSDTAYSGKTAKEFLGAKGMKGPKGDTPLAENVADQLVQDPTRLDKLKEEITKDSTFQNALAKDGTLLGKLTTKLVGDADFKKAIKMEAAISDTGFKEAVRAVESETHYDMPSNQNEPLSWHIPFSDSLLG